MLLTTMFFLAKCLINLELEDQPLNFLKVVCQIASSLFVKTDSLSKIETIKCGVPHGSNAGPLLFFNIRQ